MSEFVSKPCACGVDIVSVSPGEDDVRIAIEAHNDTPSHEEWRAVQALRQARKAPGPCICRGGEPVPGKVA